MDAPTSLLVPPERYEVDSSRLNWPLDQLSGVPGLPDGIAIPAISGPVQKVSAKPYSNPTTFLPLFAFSALGAQGRAERARVVLGSSKCRARDELAC